MNLRQIREQFRTQSGRYDLVAPDGKDTGADFYIRAGCDYLDRLLSDQDKMIGRAFKLVAANSYYTTFNRARAIAEVWAATVDTRWQLKKVSFTELRTLYAQSFTAQESSSDGPLYYSPALLRPIPDELTAQEVTDLGFVANYMDVITNGHHSYNGILYAPKPAAACMIEVVGTFYSKELLVDADQNFWTVSHPEVVLMAAMMQIEVVMRNRQGVADWKESIKDLVTDIDMDNVEEISSDVDQMKG